VKASVVLSVSDSDARAARVLTLAPKKPASGQINAGKGRRSLLLFTAKDARSKVMFLLFADSGKTSLHSLLARRDRWGILGQQIVE
jgi:hypothetical protein